jgi:hypothetical protein
MESPLSDPRLFLDNTAPLPRGPVPVPDPPPESLELGTGHAPRPCSIFRTRHWCTGGNLLCSSRNLRKRLPSHSSSFFHTPGSCLSTSCSSAEPCGRDHQSRETLPASDSNLVASAVPFATHGPLYSGTNERGRTMRMSKGSCIWFGQKGFPHPKVMITSASFVNCFRHKCVISLGTQNTWGI